MRLKTILLFGLPVLLWTGFIFTLSFHPNPVDILPPSVQRQIKKELPRPVSLDHAGHIAIYASLGALLMRVIARTTQNPRNLLPAFGWALLTSSVIALLDESLQELIPGRAFELPDLGVDLIALSAGSALACLILWLSQKKSEVTYSSVPGDKTNNL